MFKTRNQFIIELDGLTYRFDDGQLTQVFDLQEVRGDQWFISDLQTAIARTLTVEGSPKYVELLVARKLQEAGEFDEPVTVIPHWKKRKGRNTTELFFTALPTSLYHHYVDRMNDHEDNLLIFPLYSILYGILRRIAPKEPSALIFQHNRFADLVIGTRDRILHANRFVAFDTSEEQIEALWETIQAGIDTVAIEERITLGKIYLLDWLDSGPVPDWAEEKQASVYALERQRVALNEDVHHISFINAIGNQAGAHPIATLTEKAFFHTRQLAPAFNVIFAVALLIMLGAYFWCHQTTANLHKELLRLEKTATAIELKVPQGVALEELNQTIAFLKDMARYRKAPSYKHIVNDISSGFRPEMVLANLQIDYTSDRVDVELYGWIAAPFDVAHKGYQNFQSSIRRQGYQISEHRFDTEIQRSTFLVRFGKRLG
jgi:hypothetical protein